MQTKHLILILFFIFGERALGTVPEWYNEQIKDTDIHYYGIGSGLSMTMATATALNNIANKIISDNINLRINFPNFELEKIENEGKYFYVLLSVAKVELLKQQIKDLEDIDKKIKNTVDLLKDKNDFVRLKKFVELEDVIMEAKNKISTINLIGKFNAEKYIKYYNFVEKEKNKLLSNFEVKIVLLDDQLTTLEDDITALLKNNGIKVANKSNNELYVGIICEKEKIENNFFVAVIFQFKLVCNSELADYRSYSYSSYSSAGFGEAIENCVEKLKEDIITSKFQLY